MIKNLIKLNEKLKNQLNEEKSLQFMSESLYESKVSQLKKSHDSLNIKIFECKKLSEKNVLFKERMENVNELIKKLEDLIKINNEKEKKFFEEEICLSY